MGVAVGLGTGVAVGTGVDVLPPPQTGRPRLAASLSGTLSRLAGIQPVKLLPLSQSRFSVRLSSASGICPLRREHQGFEVGEAAQLGRNRGPVS